MVEGKEIRLSLNAHSPGNGDGKPRFNLGWYSWIKNSFRVNLYNSRNSWIKIINNKYKNGSYFFMVTPVSLLKPKLLQRQATVILAGSLFPVARLPEQLINQVKLSPVP